MGAGGRRYRAAAPRGAGLALALLVACTVCVATDTSAIAADGGAIVIGTKNFAGATVLSQLYGQALAAHGDLVTIRDDIGPTEAAFAALQGGELDAYAEYQGTLLEFLGGDPSNRTERTHRALQQKLDPLGLVVTAPAPALDVNGFYVTRRTARRFDLTTMSDLAKIADRLTIGAPPECEERPLCLGSNSERVYGMYFATVRKLDAAVPTRCGRCARGWSTWPCCSRAAA